MDHPLSLCRFVLLRKSPTVLKLLSAIAVLLGLILSLIPDIAGMDANSKSGNQLFLSQPRLSQILWPLCFMFGFVSQVWGGGGVLREEVVGGAFHPPPPLCNSWPPLKLRWYIFCSSATNFFLLNCIQWVTSC